MGVKMTLILQKISIFGEEYFDCLMCFAVDVERYVTAIAHTP